jgi:hypothetical protein
VSVSDLRLRRLNTRDREYLELVRKVYPNINSTTYFRTCFYDNIFNSEGQFLISYNRPYNSSTSVLFPLDGYHNPKIFENIYLSKPFKNKNSTLIWRGATTGPILKSHGSPEKNNRFEIVSRFANSSSKMDLGFTDIFQIENTSLIEIITKYKKTRINIVELLDFKYILCMEGNDLATNFIWVLASKSCPFHTYPFTSESIYFGTGLYPWEHFVPVAIDGHDLEEKLDWCLKNFKACEKIAINGFEYMKPYRDLNLYNEINYRILDMLIL